MRKFATTAAVLACSGGLALGTVSAASAATSGPAASTSAAITPETGYVNYNFLSGPARYVVYVHNVSGYARATILVGGTWHRSGWVHNSGTCTVPIAGLNAPIHRGGWDWKSGPNASPHYHQLFSMAGTT